MAEQLHQRIEAQEPLEVAELGGFDSEIPHQSTDFDYAETSPLESPLGFNMPIFGDNQVSYNFDFQFQGLNNTSIPQMTTDPYSPTIGRPCLTSFAGPPSFLNIDTARILFTGIPEPGDRPDQLEPRSSPGSDPKSDLTTPTSSPWVITTPGSHESLSPPPNSARTNRKRGFTPEQVAEYEKHVANNGPCSKVWELVPCEPDPYDPAGVCLNCKNVVKPIMCKLPCLRWIITDSSLYREQHMPYQLFSRRWQSMDLIDITNWASSEVKTILISQIFLDAPYEVEVREFVPVEGDMVDAVWRSGSVVKRQRAPLYALSDMEKTAKMLEQFIDANVATYINAVTERLHPLFWQTYKFAFRYIGEAKTPEERKLLANTFRLWVGCRKTSNPHRIYGNDRLGGEIVNDPDSLFHNVVPMPVIMISQMECIMYTTNLRPMSKKVLHDLNVIEEFANPESIRKHHSGAEVMLAHFHYLNKGVHPFGMCHAAKHRQELAKAAELDEDGVNFVCETSRQVNETGLQREIKEVRAAKNFGHDLYWVSQLYDEVWEPGPKA
ncbi:hypothetical protein F4775DRAFT_588403 [Biscogniauxia sp. FL1348]|nr:hypothetical protein F4775DRAFT_588403 [Biscogniauxia sp. FL1348]